MNTFKCVCCGDVLPVDKAVADLDDVCLECEQEVRDELSQPVNHWFLDEDF